MPIYVKIKGSFPGFHRWPDAPKEFYKLSILHEHTFHFVAEIREEAPREIEFLALAEQISQALYEYLQKHPAFSCEQMAEALFKWLDDGWQVPPGRVVSVEINEDDSCGAIYRLSQEERQLREAHRTGQMLLGIRPQDLETANKGEL